MGTPAAVTHGPPVAKNAHPHLDCNCQIAVIHNGIIENFQQLRKELTDRGHIFQSDTDTEAIPHLIEEGMATGLDFKSALQAAIQQCQGAFGIVACCASNPDYILVARRESPLVIGIDAERGAMYAASDIPAFLPLTRTALILNDDEIAVLKPREVEIFDLISGEQVVRDPYEVQWSIDAAEKGGYDYFMLKELHEVASKVRDQIHAPQADIDAFAEAIINANQLYITAAGTAYFACLAGKSLLTRFTNIYVHPILCSEFKDEFLQSMKSNSVVIAVSQSGETLDTIEAVRYARENFGAKVCSVVNVVGSSLTRCSDHVIITTAGPEIAVASQKAFNTQVTALCIIALRVAELLGTMDPNEIASYREVLEGIPGILDHLLDNQEMRIKELATQYAREPKFPLPCPGAFTRQQRRGPQA